MLLPYIQEDPTAFYSAEEYSKAYEMFCETCLRRAQSVRKQLDGDLASTNADQQDKDKVPASDSYIK